MNLLHEEIFLLWRKIIFFISLLHRRLVEEFKYVRNYSFNKNKYLRKRHAVLLTYKRKYAIIIFAQTTQRIVPLPLFL
jgi:CTP:phosphocholine cytidylyltransferase-like protein